MAFQYLESTRTIASEFGKIYLSYFKNLGEDSEPGGAIYSSSVLYLDVQLCLFEEDIALIGGGIFSENGCFNLYSSCFYRCRGSRIDKSDGGNAVSINNCQFICELSSAFQCSPQTNPSGDGIFSGISSKIRAISMNCSYCKGENGECSFGNFKNAFSIIKYLNSISCEEYALAMLPNGKAQNSNFINDTITTFFNYGSNGETMTLENCSYFGNTQEKEDYENVVYVKCICDERRNDITYSTTTQTYQIKQVDFANCKFGYCENISNRARLFFPLEVIPIILWVSFIYSY